MALSTLQLAGMVALGTLATAGVGGVIGFQALSQSNERAYYQPDQRIPTRSECINEGLRQTQGKNFSRQTAYDIEVRCEQLIQSMEAYKANRR